MKRIFLLIFIFSFLLVYGCEQQSNETSLDQFIATGRLGEVYKGGRVDNVYVQFPEAKITRSPKKRTEEVGLPPEIKGVSVIQAPGIVILTDLTGEKVHVIMINFRPTVSDPQPSALKSADGLIYSLAKESNLIRYLESHGLKYSISYSENRIPQSNSVEKIKSYRIHKSGVRISTVNGKIIRLVNNLTPWKVK